MIYPVPKVNHERAEEELESSVGYKSQSDPETDDEPEDDDGDDE